MNWVLYFLGAFGLAYILGHSKISFPVRALIAGSLPPELSAETVGSKPLIPVVGPFIVGLVECPACLGFWTGLLAAVLHIPCDPLLGPGWAWALCLGCITSGSNFILGRHTHLI